MFLNFKEMKPFNVLSMFLNFKDFNLNVLINLVLIKKKCVKRSVHTI